MVRAIVITLAITLLGALTHRAHGAGDRETVRAWLKKLATQAPQLGTTNARLEPARELPDQPPGRGLLLSIHHDHITLDGERPSDQDALLNLASAAVQRQKALKAGVPSVIVDVEGRAPWPAVTRSLENLAAAGITDVAFRFARPPLPRPFDKTPIDPDLAAISAIEDPAGKAMRMAQLAQRVLATCPRASKAFAGLATVGPQDRSAVFLSLLDRMLADQSCALDAASVQGLVVGLVGGSGLQSLHVRLDKKAKLRPMAGFNATWHEVVAAGLLDKAFAGKGQPAWFVVAPR
jgi:hypothetical protein